MKIIGQVLLALGVLWGIYAFNLDTTVTTSGETLGSGEYKINIPSVTVNNIGLMEQRRNHLIGAGIAIIVGTLLLGFGVLSEAKTGNMQNSTASDEEKTFSGDRNLGDPNYQLFLTKKYGIERNNTLQKFVCNEIVYGSLEEALKVVHKLETGGGSEERTSIAPDNFGY